MDMKHGDTKWKTEAQAIFLNPFTVLFIVQTEVSRLLMKKLTEVICL
jgi:hypothetical protein